MNNEANIPLGGKKGGSLKLASKDYTPVTCYQISTKGLELLKQVSKADKEAVHELAYAPGTRELLKVHWTGNEYWLHTDAFKRRSTVTETEDVSYLEHSLPIFSATSRALPVSVA